MPGNRKSSFFGLIFGLVVLAIGIYMSLIEGRGYLKTTAVIDHIDETYGGEDTDYDVYVTYTVDGKTYQGRSDYYASGYHEGKEIQIYYNPDHPEQIHGDSKGFGIFMIAAGVILMIFSIILFLRSL